MTGKRMIGPVLKSAITLGAVLITCSAGADQIVTFAAYECNGGFFTGDQGGRHEGLAFNGGGTLCPMDRLASDVAGNINTIVIRVRDNSTSGAVTCRGVSCNGQGDSCNVTNWVPSGGTGNPGFTGSTFMNLGSVAAHSTGYAYIECTFPSGSNSYVYSYRSTD